MAHEVIPIGAVNAKGQLKWQNPNNPEDIRFISMREGRVRDPESGAPVKPPKSQ